MKKILFSVIVPVGFDVSLYSDDINVNIVNIDIYDNQTISAVIVNYNH